MYSVIDEDEFEATFEMEVMDKTDDLKNFKDKI